MIAENGRVESLTLSDALALGAGAWNAFHSGQPIATPFLDWAWHRAWTTAVPHELEKASQVFVLRGGSGDIAALFPVRLLRTRFRRVPVTALIWATGDLGCPDHLDVPARPDADLSALAAAVDELPWDVTVLGSVAEQSPNFDRLCGYGRERGWVVRRTPLWPCPYIVLPSSWDEYLAGLTTTRRQTIRRKERNLFRNRAVRLVDYGPERLLDGWRHLRRLHALRWGGPAALGAPAMEALHLAYAETLASEGKLWLTTIDVDDVPVAAWYGFAHGDTVYFYQGGWDSQWERFSVAAVLMGLMIRRAIERGYRVFDFLRGAEPYKLQWTSSVRTCYEVAIVRSSLRGAALRLLDRAALWRNRMRGLSESALRS